MPKKIKICLVGAGSFANFVHGPALKYLASNDPALELGCVCDFNREKAVEFADKFGFPRVSTDLDAMLKTENPDGVAVLTGVSATAEVAGRVLAQGFPVMMEKPPGRNRAEIEHLMQCSEKATTPAMVAFNRRYSPLLTQGLKLFAATGDKLEHIRCDFYRRERLDDDFATTAIHGIDAVRHLAGGAYDSVKLDYQELEREKNTCNIYLNCRFDNGVYGTISFCPSTGAVLERYTLLSRHWTVMIESVVPGGGSDRPGRIFVYREGRLDRIEAPEPHPLDSQDFYLAGYFSENEAFVRNLREGFPTGNDLAMSLAAVEIADALRFRQSQWKA